MKPDDSTNEPAKAVPEAAKPEAAKPEAAKPEAAKPEAARAGAAPPDAEPKAAEPVAAEPVAAEPVPDPVAVEPSASTLAAAFPAATEPDPQPSPAAEEPRVTIVVVPRERFSLSDKSLETLYACTTDVAFNLVYVDGNSPKEVRSYLAEAASRRGFTLVRSDRFLSPNQARNLGMRHVKTPYVVFVDNDLFVTPGWLPTLIRCADETGAWVVGPLYCQGDPADKIIHMAEGWITLTGDAPNRTFATNQSHQGVAIADVPEPLVRRTCDYAEFHCMFLRTDVFDKIGPLDENLMNTREHLDVCMQVVRAGGEVWFEPAAVVTYSTPPPFANSDIPFYWTRWSESWGQKSLSAFCDKYGIRPDYSERVRNMAHRRQRVFTPVRRLVKRSLGKKADGAVTLAIAKVEPHVNRLFVKVPGS
ncbi:MAG: glycosyltransferase [Acidimicrobiales bacterium]